MTYALTWLADVLRSAGCTVIEEAGWKSRGTAEMGTVRGVLLHHTAGARTGNTPSLALVRDGRKDLAGPLSHLLLARDGTYHVLAAGRCNHAGAGSWHGVTSGNSSFIGIEAENAGDGKDPWPEVQMAAYAQGVAALLKYVGADAVMAAGHKEYALPKGRKIDPSFDMVAFREHVENFIGLGFTTALGAMPVPATDPVRAMLFKGAMGESVKELQRRLGFTGGDVDGDFGPATDRAVRSFQEKHGLNPDGKVGPKTWKALGV